MEKFINQLIEIGKNLAVAILIVIIGFYLVKVLVSILKKGKGFNKLEKSVQTFLLSFIKITLKTIVLIIAALYLTPYHIISIVCVLQFICLDI